MPDQHDLEPIDPSTAVEMYLQERETEVPKATLRVHKHRLDYFQRWYDKQDIENLNALSGWRMHQYRLWRREVGNLSNVGLKTRMDTIRVFIRLCERIDAVRNSLCESVASPSLSPNGDYKKTTFTNEEATKILSHLERFQYAPFQHTLLLLLWRTGVRLGAACRLDLQDYGGPQVRIRLHHKLEWDTPLKNGSEEERLIALRPDTCEMLTDWIGNVRPDMSDDYGREPLLITSQGRVSQTAIRKSVYRFTRPCEYTRECPHGREVATCEALDGHRKSTSKCPSLVSPHDMRRRSITHFPSHDVLEKVINNHMNIGQQVLLKHYDQGIEERKVE